jgi:SPP1 gp7 family putative phage head morphogenesis protein
MKRPTRTVKGTVLRPSAAPTARYAADLERLIDRMIAKTEREVTKLFTGNVAIESHVTTDASISSQSRIMMNALISEFSVMFRDAAKPVSQRMASSVLTDSKTGAKRSLMELGKETLSLKTDVLRKGPVAEVVKATVAENVALIKSIPEQYLRKVNSAVMRSITSGNGLQDLVPFMEKQKGITVRHARNMALDQTRKAYNGINKGRMQMAGVESFEWIHSGGSQKPRPDHVEMHGQIFRFDNPPVIDKRTGEKGIPGQAPNCRCTMRPILTLGEG